LAGGAMIDRGNCRPYCSGLPSLSYCPQYENWRHPVRNIQLIKPGVVYAVVITAWQNPGNCAFEKSST
jgi:hypothetical protein